MPRKPTLRRQIDALLTQFGGEIRTAFLLSIVDIRSDVVLKLLIERLERRDIKGALDALNLDRAAFHRVETALQQAYLSGGVAITGNMPILRDGGGARILVRFDVRNLRAETWLRDHSSTLVTNILDDQRTAIRAALELGMSRGSNPRTVALDLIGRVSRPSGRRAGGLIGLTGNQSQYVQNARNELLSGDPALLRNYLTRSRRYKPSDRTILKAIRNETPLDAATINRLVGRYSDGLLKLRGDTIARTEALTSIHAGKLEGFRQGLDKTNYPPEAVTRVWRSAADGRVRHTHSAMNGQEVHGLDTPFVSPTGARLKFPGDTSLGAGAEEIINCRCDDDYRIDFSFGVD